MESRLEKLGFLDLAIWGSPKTQKYSLSTENIAFYCYFHKPENTSTTGHNHTFHSDNKQLNTIVDLIVKHAEKTKNIKEELDNYSKLLEKILELKPTKKQIEKLLENQNTINQNFDYIKEQNSQIEKSLRKTNKLEDSINSLLIEITASKTKEVELLKYSYLKLQTNLKIIEKFEKEIQDLREILEYLKHQST
uniref:p24 protein n=1 Tax=Rice tungro bacilliform virus TaxID=10654 RepID=C4QUK0_9VIRU|nr:P24 protein [Rice tungro bacilliform virus]